MVVCSWLFFVSTWEDGSAAWFGGAGRVGDAVGGGVTMGWRVSWGHSSWRLSRQKQLPRNHIPVPSYSDNQSRLSPARRFNQSWIRISYKDSVYEVIESIPTLCFLSISWLTGFYDILN